MIYERTPGFESNGESIEKKRTRLDQPTAQDLLSWLFSIFDLDPISG